MREMGRDLNINPSRIFRLLNGHEMKLSEYEKLKRFLDRNQIESSDLYQLAKSCEQRLSLHNLNSLVDEMKMLLYCKKNTQNFSLPEGA